MQKGGKTNDEKRVFPELPILIEKSKSATRCDHAWQMKTVPGPERVEFVEY